MNQPESSERGLISTDGRTKIPHDWSYPIGAEIVSKALADAPQYSSTYLRFLWVKAAKTKTIWHLLSVEFSDPKKTALRTNWRIDISAVPGELRAEIRELLITQVLPRARIWMTEKRNPAWFAGFQWLSASFNTETKCIEYQEKSWG